MLFWYALKTINCKKNEGKILWVKIDQIEAKQKI